MSSVCGEISRERKSLLGEAFLWTRKGGGGRGGEGEGGGRGGRGEW